MSDPEDGPWDDATAHDDGAPPHDSDQMEGEDPPTTRATLAQQVRMRSASRIPGAAHRGAGPSTLAPPRSPDRLPAQASSVHDHITPVALPIVMSAAVRQSRETGDAVIVLDKVARALAPAPVPSETAAGGIVVIATGADGERVRKLCHAHGLLVPILASLGAAHESAAVIVIGEPSLPASPQVAHVARTALPDAALLDLLRGLVGGRVVVDPPVATATGDADTDARVADFAHRISSLDDRGAIEHIAIEAITVITHADRARLLFFDSSTGALWSEAARIATPSADLPRAAAGMVGWSAYTGRALHASPAGDDPRYLTELDDPEGKAQSRLLVQPVIGADRRTHAVLVAARRWRHNDFSDADRIALISFAAQIAAALDIASASGPHSSAAAEAPRRPRSTLPGVRPGTDPATRSALVSAPPRPASDSRPPPVTARRSDSRPPPLPGAMRDATTTLAAGSTSASSPRAQSYTPAAGSTAAAPRAQMNTPAAGSAAASTVPRAQMHTPAAGSAAASESSAAPRAQMHTPAAGSAASESSAARAAHTPASGSAAAHSSTGNASAPRASDSSGPLARAASEPGRSPTDARPPRARTDAGATARAGSESGRSPTDSQPPRARTESGGNPHASDPGRTRTPSDPPRKPRTGGEGDPIDVAIVATAEDDIARIRRIARKARLEVSVLARAEDAPPYYRLVTLGEAWTADTDTRVAYAARSTITDDQLADLLVGLSRDRAPAALVAAKPQSAAEAKRAQLAFTSSRKLAQSTDLADAETLTTDALRELLDADRAYCLYYSNEDAALWSEARRRSRGDDRRAIAGVVGWTARTGRPVNVPRASADPRWLGPLDDPDGDMHSQLLVQPIVASDRRVTGVLVVARRTKRPPFSDLDVTVLEQFAALASPLIEQLQLSTVSQQMLRAPSTHDLAALDTPIQSLQRWLRSLPRWTYAVGGAALMLLIVLIATC